MSDVTSRLTAALADRYRVDRELGAGGMATVYLAHDLKHDRDVAIKVLHPDLGAALGGERFLSEIRTTARLQHPHILPLLDSGDAGTGLLYYVMPLVTGETLRARLERERQLPIADAVRIAREVASALDYAHRQNVIHRDIKPENILLHDGQAIVADFGIALAVQSAGGARMTQTGLSLGTPQYMSPEQAMGERTIDARSDIYALGAMTYEMLAGDAPFTGSSVQAIVAKVLSSEPEPLSVVRKTVPEHIDAAVLTALAKLPADRYASAAEFATALQADGVGRATRVGPGERTRGTQQLRGLRVALGAVTALAIIATIAAVRAWQRPRTEASVTVAQFELPAPPGLAHALRRDVTSLAISPDGKLMTLGIMTPTGSSLAVRSLDRLDVRVLPGTSEATYPAFSPDGKWIAFDAGDGFLKRIAVDGSSLTNICPLPSEGASGVTWLSDQELVYTSSFSGQFAVRVSVNGGPAVRAARPDSANDDQFHTGPVSVGDGRHVVVSSTSNNGTFNRVALIDLRDSSTTVFPSHSSARVIGVIDGAIVYVQPDGALMAAPIDLSARSLGTAVKLADSISVRSFNVGAALSASGTLLALRGGATRELVRVTQAGVATKLLGDERSYLHPRLSPDGRRIAFEVVAGRGGDVWVADLALQTTERVTRDERSDRPEWSPDGRRLLYSTGRTPPSALYEQPADGSGQGVKVIDGAGLGVREGVYTPDGRSIVYRVDTKGNARDILQQSIVGNRTPVPLLVGPSDEKQPRVSPDGRWLAYVSNESGREEVYVRALAPGGGRVAVSSAGGGEPLWSRDGRRLFYREGSKLMAADLAVATAATVTGRAMLFDGPFETDQLHPNYDVFPDGREFVMVRTNDESRRLVVVLNWVAEIRQRLGRAK